MCSIFAPYIPLVISDNRRKFYVEASDCYYNVYVRYFGSYKSIHNVLIEINNSKLAYDMFRHKLILYIDGKSIKAWKYVDISNGHTHFQIHKSRYQDHALNKLIDSHMLLEL